ncbi:MAG: replication-associated recombination protein A [Acidimicrobiia bacterium]
MPNRSGRDKGSDDLFEHSLRERFDEYAPLAARMRPRTLDEFVGQEHLVGKGGPLRSLISSDRLSSMILFGPAGTGKTSLANIIAGLTGARFVELSAVNATVADLRKGIAEAKEALGANGRRTILFIDEVHRFNKAQQDALLPGVEKGHVILIGATTENPFFEINSPLISRSLLFRLEPHTRADTKEMMTKAIEDGERGLGSSGVSFDDDAIEHILDRSGGDGRAALNALEVCAAAAISLGTDKVDLKIASEALQQPIVRYDKSGDVHYDQISAFIKSLRGSDPDAALWWMARMIEGGEDPRFIARRLVIFASEDVGNADPIGLVVAVSAFHALEFVGLPEARLNLAQAVTYLATAPKSNASMIAISRASEDVRAGMSGEVPKHLRDSSYPGARRLGHGKGYKYPHDFPEGWVDQDYRPPELEGRVYYEPTDRGVEKEIRERLERFKKGEK